MKDRPRGDAYKHNTPRGKCNKYYFNMCSPQFELLSDSMPVTFHRERRSQLNYGVSTFTMFLNSRKVDGCSAVTAGTARTVSGILLNGKCCGDARTPHQTKNA